MKPAALVIAMLVGVGHAAAEPTPRGALVVPVVGEHGVAVYCTRNLSPGVATPVDGGGYRVAGLAHGRYVVRLELPHEKIDLLAVVPVDGDAVVPPIVARGRCRSIEVVARAATSAEPSPDDDGPMWSLRYARSYSAGPPLRPAELDWTPRSRRASIRSR